MPKENTITTWLSNAYFTKMGVITISEKQVEGTSTGRRVRKERKNRDLLLAVEAINKNG